MTNIISVKKGQVLRHFNQTILSLLFIIRCKCSSTQLAVRKFQDHGQRQSTAYISEHRTVVNFCVICLKLQENGFPSFSMSSPFKFWPIIIIKAQFNYLDLLICILFPSPALNKTLLGLQRNWKIQHLILLTSLKCKLNRMTSV